MRSWLKSVALGAAVAACVGMSAQAATATPATKFRPGAGGVGDHWFPTYGNGGYQVSHYSLDLSYDPHSGRLGGRTTIQARATQNLSRFDLDLQGLTVSKITVDGVPARYSRKGHKLVITPPWGLVDRSRFTVGVDYAGVPKPIGSSEAENGFIRTNDGAFVVDTGIAADTWFPCNDHPQDKASFTFRIRVPKNRSVVANGRLLSSETSGQNTTFVWNEPMPMATYLATFDVGKWNIKSGRTPGGIPEYVAVDPQLSKQHTDPTGFFWNNTAKITDRWAKLFGPYPFDSTGAIADYTDINGKPIGFAEETQTRPVYGSVEDETDMAHELAHQWFGDSVSLTDFDEIWLNEGFATWAAWYWVGINGGTPVATEVREQYAAFPAGDSYWKHPVSPAIRNVTGGARVYYGGAMALEFLREKIGDPKFFDLLRAWTGEYRYRNATTADFVALANKVSGQDLTRFFHTWIYGTGKPPLPRS